MPAPVRLRLSRAKGFDLQSASRAANGLDAVSVTRPGRWGNPFRIAKDNKASVAVERYRDALVAGRLPYTAADVAAALRGRNLACWCKTDAPCHADVLLELANSSAICEKRRLPRC